MEDSEADIKEEEERAAKNKKKWLDELIIWLIFSFFKDLLLY
jgi:hypothetical protein